jgi:hypothetical protein
MIRQLLLFGFAFAITFTIRAQYAGYKMTLQNNYEYALIALLDEEQALFEEGTTQQKESEPAAATQFIMNMKVYPNPTAGHLVINFSESYKGNYSAELYDLSGKLVHQHNFEISQWNEREKMDLSVFAEGIFVLKLIYTPTGTVKTFLVAKQ